MITWVKTMNKMWLHKAICTVFGLGMAPFAPGTFGALGAVLFYFGLYHFEIDFGLVPTLISILVLTLIGIWSTNALEDEWGQDPSRVVIDEFVGIMVTMILVPVTPINIIIAFILFRFFDITKPLGIRKVDTVLKSGIGVMLDDILAGVYSCISMHILLYFVLN